MNGLWMDKSMGLLQAGLDTAAERHRVSSNNVANVNTPGFKRSDVYFEEELRRALAGNGKLQLAVTHPRHLQPRTDQLKHSVRVDTTHSMRADGNNVDVDREMAGMAANQLMYNAMSQLVSEKYSLMRYVIHEGRR